jgi:muramoyltetrapeptide carboxypeptidase
VVAPAGPFDRESFDKGLAVLAERYEPVFDPGIFSRHRYLAGDDGRRLRELSQALADEEARAVFCARGGFGAMRLLPRLTVDGLPPRLLVGFSDITALHLTWQRAGRVTLHGPVMTQLGKQPREAVERLFRVLESPEPAPPLEGGQTVVPGVAEGPLVGGNLSVLTRLLGTPYLPPLRGALLLIEDVGERPYRLDRMWQHLALAGVFEQVAGLVLGDFTLCEEKDADYTSREVVEELARETGLPCAAGFRVGHGDVNLAVPLGVRARLEAAVSSGGRLDFLEPATEAPGAPA